MKKATVIIPSRYGSSRLIGKPLMQIAGKTMIQRVYQRAESAENISGVVVATDDMRIADVVASFGGNCIMTSEQNRSGTDRVAQAADLMGLGDDDIIVNLQGDQPLIEPACLNEVSMPFFKESGVCMSTLACVITNKREILDPKDVKVVFDRYGDALYFSRSTIPCSRDNDESIKIYKHLGVYAYSHKFLKIYSKLAETRLEKIEKLEQLRAMEHGYKIKVVVTKHDSPEVDIPEDIKKVEELIKKRG